MDYCSNSTTRQMKRTGKKNQKTKNPGDPGEGRDWFSESLQYSVVQSWNEMNQKGTAIQRNKINRSHSVGSPNIGFSRWKLENNCLKCVQKTKGKCGLKV